MEQSNEINTLFTKLIYTISKQVKEEILSDVQPKQTEDTGNKYLNKSEACEYLGVSNNTLTKYINREGLPYKSIDSRYFFTKEWIDEWIANK